MGGGHGIPGNPFACYDSGKLGFGGNTNFILPSNFVIVEMSCDKQKSAKFFVASYKITPHGCLRDNSYKEDIHWGLYYHGDGNNVKQCQCASECKKDPKCATYEWTAQSCSWWAKVFVNPTQQRAHLISSYRAVKRVNIYSSIIHYFQNIMF